MGPHTFNLWDRLRSLFIRGLKNGLPYYLVFALAGLCYYAGITPVLAVPANGFSANWAACQDAKQSWSSNPSYSVECQVHSLPYASPSGTTYNAAYDGIISLRVTSCGSSCTNFSPYDYAVWYFNLDAPCPASGTTVDNVIINQYYDSVLSVGPKYSTISPNSPCQCSFLPRVSYKSPARTYGSCVSTGRVFGSVSSSSDDTPVAGVSQPAPLCDGGSCYDPNENQFCASSSGGKQACVGGPTKEEQGAIPSNCALGDGIAVCAGTPDAPIPNWTPQPPSTSNQSVTTSDGEGGPMHDSKVVVYDTTGQGNNSDPGDGSTTSGSTGTGGNNGSEGTSDQQGNCPNGKTPSAGGCDAGYTDNGCDAPPTCSGDPLLCAQLREQHASRCAASKWRDTVASARSSERAALAASVSEGDGTPHTGSEAWVDGVVGSDGSGGASTSPAPELEVHRYWAQSSCPGIPDPGIPGLDVAKIAAPLCTTGSYLAQLILAMGYALGTLIFARTVSSD